MWSLLSRKWQLTVIFIFGIFAVRSYDAISAWFLQKPVSFWQSVSAAVFIVGTIVYLVGELSWRWIWKRIPWLQRHAFPDLEGVWEGELISTWIDPETGRPRPPVPITITIRQGIFTSSVSLRATESESHSIHVILERMPEIRRHRIWYSYRNAPKAQFQHRIIPHDGVAYLEIDVAADPDGLEGTYYTSRKTAGDIKVRRQQSRAGGF